MDREAWHAAVHGVAKSRTLSCWPETAPAGVPGEVLFCVSALGGAGAHPTARPTDLGLLLIQLRLRVLQRPCVQKAHRPLLSLCQDCRDTRRPPEGAACRGVRQRSARARRSEEKRRGGRGRRTPGRNACSGGVRGCGGRASGGQEGPAGKGKLRGKNIFRYRVVSYQNLWRKDEPSEPTS